MIAQINDVIEDLVSVISWEWNFTAFRKRLINTIIFTITHSLSPQLEDTMLSNLYPPLCALESVIRLIWNGWLYGDRPLSAELFLPLFKCGIYYSFILNAINLRWYLPRLPRHQQSTCYHSSAWGWGIMIVPWIFDVFCVWSNLFPLRVLMSTITSVIGRGRFLSWSWQLEISPSLDKVDCYLGFGEYYYGVIEQGWLLSISLNLMS